jgi:hypothetical protein
LPPAFATGPFEEVVLLDDVVRPLARGVLLAPDLEVLDLDVLDELDRPFRLFDVLEVEPFEVLEDPFLLLDLLELERLRVDRLLEDCVVWAMVIASLGFRASSAFPAGGADWLPAVTSV